MDRGKFPNDLINGEVLTNGRVGNFSQSPKQGLCEENEDFMKTEYFFESFHSSLWILTGMLYQSHKKRKDSLKGSVDRAIFATELELPKILVPTGFLKIHQM